MCLQGVPPSPYIKEWRRGRGLATLGAPHEESYNHKEEDSPFHVGVGEEREGERGGGAPFFSSTPSPSQVLIKLGKGGVLLPVGVGLLPACLSP